MARIRGERSGASVGEHRRTPERFDDGEAVL
jgi:hypothetical protein